MTLDAVLATRGWTPEAFGQATPEFKAAVHHALIAQTFAPGYREIAGILATETKGMSQEQKLAFIPQQVQANEQMPIYRAHLFPEDEPDE